MTALQAQSRPHKVFICAFHPATPLSAHVGQNLLTCEEKFLSFWSSLGDSVSRSPMLLPLLPLSLHYCLLIIKGLDMFSFMSRMNWSGPLALTVKRGLIIAKSSTWVRKNRKGVCREHVRNFDIFLFAQHENTYTMKHISKVIICMEKVYKVN